MARIRTIKPEFFRHEGLFELEIESKLPIRVAFAGLWTSCDRAGRFKWRPRQLKLDSLPFDDVDYSRVLDALATRGFVVKYEVDGQFYGCIPSWELHQSINNKESESIIPPFQKNVEISTACTRDPRVSDACLTPLNLDQGERKGKEWKGKEGKEINTSRKSAVVFKPDDVEQNVWDDFLAIRKAKKAPLTNTSLDGIRAEAAKAGLTLGEVLIECCSRGWQGFKASWMENNSRMSVAQKSETAYQRSMRLKMEQVCPNIAAKPPEKKYQNAADFFSTVDVQAVEIKSIGGGV